MQVLRSLPLYVALCVSRCVPCPCLLSPLPARPVDPQMPPRGGGARGPVEGRGNLGGARNRTPWKNDKGGMDQEDEPQSIAETRVVLPAALCNFWIFPSSRLLSLGMAGGCRPRGRGRGCFFRGCYPSSVPPCALF